MNKSFVLLLLTVFLRSDLGAAPTWREIHNAMAANDIGRLEGWVTMHGVKSHAAANILLVAAFSGNRPMIERMLNLGIPVQCTNEHGVAAIQKAAENGKTEVVEYLLQRGAKGSFVGYCDEPGCQGHTPLMHAACKKDFDMARMLLDAGADPRVGGDAATETAHQNGDLELYRLLQRFGGRERQTNTSSSSQMAQGAIPLASLGLTELLPGKTRIATRDHPKSKTRLAVIADENNVIPGDLLTVKLTGDPSFELMERQELDRVLSERKLTRHFAIDTANYGQVAELLRADALLLIRGREVAGKKVVESRLLRVNPGLVLDTVYSPAPISHPADWAERMSGRVAGFSTKVTGPGAIALSLLSVSSSIHSTADRGLDRTLAVMLSDRLAHQPHFILLERSAMERLSSENAGKFWTGSYLVDGNIEPALDSSGAFTLSVRFKPAGRGGVLTFKSMGRRANPGLAIDDLLAKISVGLSQSPAPQPRDLADEAQHYLEEASWALATDQAALAQSAAEAAWALGSRSIELARLRVLTAIYMVRDLCRGAAGKQDNIGPAGCLDLAQHGLTIWRETLDGDLLRGKPGETRKWLEFGFEAIDGAVAAAALQIGTAAEQVRHADRLKKLRETCWEILEQTRKRSKEASSGEALENRASEREAALARFLFPDPSGLIPMLRELLSRQFMTNSTLTRARIRANLAYHWDFTGLPAQFSRTPTRNLAWPQPRSDETCRQVVRLLGSSPAPEDRYLSAAFALRVAGLRGAVSPADVERLCTSLLAVQDLLSEGGELFSLYFGLFDSLDKMKGVPFFAMTEHQRGIYHLERHTPEHSRFRIKLFVAVAAKAKKPDTQFTRMLSQDDFTPEQEKEVANARAALESLGPPSARPATPRGAPRPRLGSVAGVSGPNPRPAPSLNGVPRLRVGRLWHPFNLGLEMPAEFAVTLNMQWIEERIWVHGYTLDQRGQADRHFLFAIHPETLRTETFSVPEPSSGPDARFVITQSHLLVNLRGRFAAFDRAKARWDTYPEIKPVELSPPILVGDRVYLSVLESPGNALISFDLNARTTEILTSTRRRPALGPFDDPALPITAVKTNELHELVVSSGKVSHVWSPGKRTWRPYQPSAPEVTKPPTPAHGRVGFVKRVDNILVLRLARKGTPALDVPLAFALPPGTRLPQSRYHRNIQVGQNIWPSQGWSFEKGLFLVPGLGASGFWVVPQQELDDYLRQRTETSKAVQTSAN